MRDPQYINDKTVGGIECKSCGDIGEAGMAWRSTREERGKGTSRN